MKLRLSLLLLFWTILFSTAVASCISRQTESIPLASFTENYVDVSVSLIIDSAGKSILSATFTPPEGYHLYSKDIPVTGINGLGRPTLLELAPASLIEVNGPLAENVKAQTSDFEPRELLVYPLGPVTLSLPVVLPPGADWIEDEIAITYMACSASQCKPPVVGKTVPVRIPGVDALDKQ